MISNVEAGEKRSGLAAAVVGGTVFLAGGHSGETPLKLFEAFQPGEEIESRGHWRKLDPMLARRTYCSAIGHESKIYIIGGSADGRALNTFEVFDADTGDWADWFTKPPMHVKRTLHQAAVCKGRLFVCGGFDGMRDLSSLEEFDIACNGWKWHTPMDRGRSYFALVSCNESLYAIGGQDRGGDSKNPRAHTSVERFDLYSERWFESAPLLEGRVGCAAGALTCDDGNEYIHVCGGSDGETELMSMERYDPREDKWEEAPAMSEKRLGHAVVVVNNRLYAIGGFDGREALGTFECFDPIENRWSRLLKMGAISPMLGNEDASSSATSAQ
eukprot:CAMPEP_0203865190 /NCGR_PEP_ID=MMETSP0359-20131031/15212_1 /ASSEMBLY_ACC=CAM_ASM_000338 /TAXON_ID=268821 /ORGANISM="Scrippsiella Hangoei, Strain SHTV-5" /LENGTH=328 /DNA_ID=CAMNT_0050783069 /DNA_START=83 /DNA_END=1069 /DNA_ORIENTATION=+